MKDRIFIRILFLLMLVGSLNACECTRWAQLPILINVNGQSNIETLEKMNEVFGFVLFLQDENGIEIMDTPENQMPKGDAGVTYTSCGGDGIINQGHILIDHRFYNSSLYSNILAHELFHLLGFSRHLATGLMSIPAPLDKPIAQLITQEMIDWLHETYPEIK